MKRIMVSNRIILRNSALSWTTKKMALDWEVCRHFLNTSPDLVVAGAAEEFIEKFQYKLMVSGY